MRIGFKVGDGSNEPMNSMAALILQLHLLSAVNTLLMYVEGKASGSSMAGNIMVFKVFCWLSTPPLSITSAGSDRDM